MTTRLSLGSFERAAVTLRELEAKLGFVVFGWAVAKLQLAVAAVLSLAGLEQVAAVTTGLGLSSLEQATAKLNTGDFEWATAGLRKLEVWVAVTRAATAMAAVVKAVVVMVSLSSGSGLPATGPDLPRVER